MLLAFADCSTDWGGNGGHDPCKSGQQSPSTLPTAIFARIVMSFPGHPPHSHSNFSKNCDNYISIKIIMIFKRPARETALRVTVIELISIRDICCHSNERVWRM